MSPASPPIRLVPSAAASPRFLLRTLGRFELFACDEGGEPVDRVLSSGKPLAVLVYCACHPRRAHRRDLLADLLWADAAPDRRRQNLRQALWRLRRVLGDLLLDSEDAIAVADGVVCDRTQLIEALRAGDVSVVVSLYRGLFLSGVSLPGGDEFEEWIGAEQRRLDAEVVGLVSGSVRRAWEQGRADEARQWLQALLATEHDSLPRLRAVAELALEIGELAIARRAADAIEAVIGSLDDPDGAVATVARVRQREVVPVERQLPRTAMELMGRDPQFGRIIAAWRRALRGETQLVSVSGPAGIGKSRLLDAVRARCASGESAVVVVRAVPGERQMPFAFAAQLARALVNLPGALGVGATTASDLVALDPSLGTVFRGSAAATIPESDLVRRRMLALSDLVQAICEQQPLALLLDDLHWCDEHSTAVVRALLDRLTALPLLVVGTARGLLTVLGERAHLTQVPLLPLALDAAVDAVRSSGTWPNDPGAEQFISALARQSEGVPQAIVARLDLAVERQWLVHRDGQWHSPDWIAATDAIGVASPLDHLLTSCTAPEREALLLLAVAGTPVGVWSDVALPVPGDRAMWERLEARGLLVLDGTTLRLSHDEIMERLLRLSTAEERAVMHQRLATAYAASDSTPLRIAALRHAVDGQGYEVASRLFVSLVKRLRHRGDRRPLAALVTDLVDPSTPPVVVRTLVGAVPLWYQRPWIPPFIVGSGGLVLVLLLLWIWQATHRPAELQVVDGGNVTGPMPLYGATAVRLVPPLRIRAGRDSLRTARAPITITARAGHGVAQLLAGETAVTDSTGRATFGGLRFRMSDSIATLHFDAPGMASTVHTVRRSFVVPEMASVSLVGGTLAGQPVRGPQASITVPPGALISGIVQLRYTTAWAAASVWASMTPTWGSRRESGRDLVPVSTPVRDDVVDLPIDLRAPLTPGREWILIAIAAEPSGGFTLSRTNWTVGGPLWDDGHDLADLPDSVIVQANQVGYVEAIAAFPAQWNTTGRPCSAPRPSPRGPVKYCPEQFALTGIRVNVSK